MKLYEISNDIKRLINDSDEIPVEALNDTLESLNMELEEKVENIIKAIKNKKAEKNAYKEEADSFNKKAKSCDSAINGMTNYLKLEMDKLEIKSLKVGNHSIGIMKGRQVVNIIDDSAIPDDYITSEFIDKIDKKKILADLKANVEVSGAEIKINPSTIQIK